MNIPRITIAATNSGCGKTTVSMGIMAALKKRGLKVQPFKVGPDYIDPMYHTFITGNYSRNLDSWMLKEDTVSYLFTKNAKDSDIAVIEGVMGLYDGFGGSSIEGSTAHVSHIIYSPIILVLNAEGMSLSAAAMVKGFCDFHKGVNIRGVILNQINSVSYYNLLKEIIEENTGVKVIGYLPKIRECSLPGRHLGLVPDGEIKGLKVKLDLLADNIEKSIDLDLLLEIAKEAEDIEMVESGQVTPEAGHCIRIGVARDSAFNFYYQDNLELLQMMGANIVYFSPLNDSGLPDDLQGLYIGGGFPEVFATELQNNISMRRDIKEKIFSGLPVYAECGGLMYLSESIRDMQGNAFDMVGAIPGKCEMTSCLQRFGYVEVEVTEDNVLAEKGYRIRGHEFHYSVINVEENIQQCLRVIKTKKGRETKSWSCGFKTHNVLAGYPHIHFWSNKKFAECFLNSCKSAAWGRFSCFDKTQA